MAGLRGAHQTERGAAAVLACACLALLMAVGVGLGVVASLFHAHRQAQAAADLAALAGAHNIQRGHDGCGAAAELAIANGGALVGCVVNGEEVVVDVQVPGPHWLGLSADPTAQARAGPG